MKTIHQNLIMAMIAVIVVIGFTNVYAEPQYAVVYTTPHPIVATLPDTFVPHMGINPVTHFFEGTAGYDLTNQHQIYVPNNLNPTAFLTNEGRQMSVGVVESNYGTVSCNIQYTETNGMSGTSQLVTSSEFTMVSIPSDTTGGSVTCTNGYGQNGVAQIDALYPTPSVMVRFH